MAEGDHNTRCTKKIVKILSVIRILLGNGTVKKFFMTLKI